MISIAKTRLLLLALFSFLLLGFSSLNFADAEPKLAAAPSSTDSYEDYEDYRDLPNNLDNPEENSAKANSINIKDSETQKSGKNYIHIVGSSTVFPFISSIAEEFARGYRVKTPIIESTGTGAGFKLFCGGQEDNTPDITVASRKINSTEIELCKLNNIKAEDILELKLGDDALIIASAIEGKTLNFTKRDIFNALALYVPDSNLGLKKNNYQYWRQINPVLPEYAIKVYGPLRNTGTFDSLVNTVFKDQCFSSEAFKITYSADELLKICAMVRTDGVFTEVSADENIVIQRIIRVPDSFGILGYSFLMRNMGKIKGHLVNCITPTYENILNGSYPLSRPLYLYVKRSHIQNIQSLKLLKPFLKEVFSDNALGEYGYLKTMGLVPPNSKSLEETREKVEGW